MESLFEGLSFWTTKHQQKEEKKKTHEPKAKKVGNNKAAKR